MSIHNRTSLTFTLAAVVAVASACAAPGSSGASGPPGSDEADASLPAGEVPEALLGRVIADAASGAGVDPSAVEVISAEAVTWSDGALGCPLPDQMYTQALVPGYRVVLDVDGEEMSFHAAEDGEFAFCADPQPPAEGGTVDR